MRKMSGLRKQLPWTHGVVPGLLAGDLRRPDLLGLLLEGLDHRRRLRHRGLRPRPRPGSAIAGRLHPAAAALGTAFYMSRLYFLVSPGRRAPTTVQAPHPRVAGDGGRSWCWPSAPRWVGSSACRGDCPIAPTNLPRPPPRAGDRRGAAIPHSTELIFMVASRPAWPSLGIGLAYVFYGGGYRAPAVSFAPAASSAWSSWCRTSSASTSCTPRSSSAPSAPCPRGCSGSSIASSSTR